MTKLRSVLRPNALYFCDNGRVLHGRCAGMTAQATGRDLDGLPCERITMRHAERWIEEFNRPPQCEQCHEPHDSIPW